ncbi:MAG: PAS domain S-box protein [Candidatus Bathyarchaeia archaeon]
MVISKDVTDAKKAMETARAILERYRSFVEVSGELGWISNADGDVEEDIPSWRKFTGQTYEEVKGWGWFKAIHPDDLEHTESVWKKAIKTKNTYEVEYRLRRYDGVYRLFEVRGVPMFREDGSVLEWIGTCIDITERKKVEEDLRKQAAIIDLSPDAIIVKNSDDTITLWNQGAEKLYKWTKNEAIGQKIQKLLGSEFSEPLKSINDELKRAGRWSGEVVHHTKDGRTKILQSWWLAKRNKNGELVEILESNVDITDRKKIEQELSISFEELQRRESEISALLKASKAVLQNKDFQDSARAIFDACKELIGATAGYVALLSKNGKENEVLFLDSGGLPCTVDPLLPMPIRGLRAEAYSSRKVAVENKFKQSEWTKFMPEGHVQLTNVLFAPLIIEKKVVGVIGLANKPAGFTERDTEMALAFGEIASVALANSQMLGMLEENEKELKSHSEHLEALVEERTKKLRDSERLAAIGETAGMVGHDIRNPLQSITGELYLARNSLDSLPDTHAKEDLRESIGYIEEQLTYVNKIVQDLQDYAKTPKPQLQETDLEKAVKDVLSSMNIPKIITVSSTIKTGFPKINTDQLYLKRILTNLTSNAIQAMPNGGKIAITATCKDEKVFITVADTGEGIPDDIKEKIFKPLFTTKAKGQGFGLAVIKKLTEALNGKVTVESQIGKGTQFTVEFPMT